MPLSGHLREARTRAVRVAAALVVGVVVGYLLSDPLLDIVRAPIERLAESRSASLNFDSVTGAFDLRLKIALVAGVVLAAPVWLYEIFAYARPGLTRRERRYTLGYALVSFVLFAAGCLCGFLLFPHMVELLAGFASADDSTILSASAYVDFVLKTIVALGVAFVLPVLIVLLNALGVISAATVRSSWRLGVVGIATFSALATPAADVLSMFLVAVPMAALYGAAIVVTHVHDRRVARRAHQLDTSRSTPEESPCSV